MARHVEKSFYPRRENHRDRENALVRRLLQTGAVVAGVGAAVIAVPGAVAAAEDTSASTPGGSEQPHRAGTANSADTTASDPSGSPAQERKQSAADGPASAVDDTDADDDAALADAFGEDVSEGVAGPSTNEDDAEDVPGEAGDVDELEDADDATTPADDEPQEPTGDARESTATVLAAGQPRPAEPAQHVSAAVVIDEASVENAITATHDPAPAELVAVPVEATTPVVAEPTSQQPVAAIGTEATAESALTTAARAPVTWQSIVDDIWSWFNLGDNPPALPATRVNFIVEALWVSVRRVHYILTNQRPVAVPTQETSDPHTGEVVGNLNATDPEDDNLTFVIRTPPEHGSVVVNEDGSYVYTPNPDMADFGGIDRFTVRIGDTTGNPWHLRGFAEALGLVRPTLVTVTVTVDPVNQSPAAEDVDVVVGHRGQVSGVINAADPNGDTLSYTIGNPPVHGTVDLDPLTGNFVYTPAIEVGPIPEQDFFTVRIDDGLGGVAEAQVTVHFLPNSAPVISSAVTVQHPYDGAVEETYITFEVLDRDGDEVSVQVVLHPDDFDKGHIHWLDPAGRVMFHTYPHSHRDAFDDPDNAFARVIITATDEFGAVTVLEQRISITPAPMHGPVGMSIPSDALPLPNSVPDIDADGTLRRLL